MRRSVECNTESGDEEKVEGLIDVWLKRKCYQSTQAALQLRQTRSLYELEWSGGRERERERERETYRQTETDTDGQRQSDRDGERSIYFL